eukprot:11803836-Alexandrium_andersonii.AAC.1
MAGPLLGSRWLPGVLPPSVATGMLALLRVGPLVAGAAGGLAGAAGGARDVQRPALLLVAALAA